MALFYLDTSALVKLYVREAGTDQMTRLADPSSGNSIAVLRLSRVEFRSAVRQRERLGNIPHDTADALIASLEAHLKNLYVVHPVSDCVVEAAVALLDRHPLRAYDAVQLAGCISLRSRSSECPAFVCSDRVLLRAAVNEGLAVFDPAK